MVERDTALAKIAIIDRCLERIADVRGQRGATLLPIDVEDIVLLNLQRGVQAAIDLASHVVASEGYGLPESVAASFTLLEQHRVIDAALAGRLRRMTGFRNIAVHNYRALDPTIVESIVTHRLDDLPALAEAVTRRFLL